MLIGVYIIITVNIRALKKAEAETSEKNWTLGGSEELVRNLQGNKNVKDLAYSAISHLANYLDLPAAGLYLTNESGDALVLTATYALNSNDQSETMLPYGKGLAGQAARENKVLFMKDIPENYFSITTSFGTIQPRDIVAVPFSLEENVIGVMELASLKNFSEIQMDYLRIISTSVAIAIVSGLARKKTANLLEETQRQSEELNAQQEELRQSNDELQQKTTQLEESEQELKAQQEELEQINKELEYKAEMLEEQNNKIENSRLLVETKANEVELISKYKSEFLANMSHELRTPLNSILILSQLLAENRNKTLGEKEVSFSKNIYNSGNDLLNLINEILDLSKIESGKMDLEIEAVELEDLINHINDLFAEVAKSKSLNFKIQVRDELRHSIINTDKQRVEQILKNLIANAFKFTPKGGHVALRIEPGRDTPEDQMLAFSVSDTGIGIPEQKRAIIFEAFQQADGSTKRQYGGTGLGLSISRELAKALGGEIGLKSEEGKGSEFTLYLPVTFSPNLSVSEKEIAVREKKQDTSFDHLEPMNETSTATLIANDDRNEIHKTDRVVLIIEDDAVFAQVLLNFLHEKKYKGIIANQGNVGVSYARHYKPDAIMLDLSLPVMDGMDVLKQIKNDPELRHIPVQIISGLDKKMKGLELGAFDFIQKPIALKDLQKAFARIEKFISKKLKKLLVVEDNSSHSQAIIELVGSTDIKCIAAYRGDEAYDLLAKEEFDCMIVDLNLPDMSGFELLEKIKANAAMKGIPIVVYTGKDLNKEENARLQKLANTVILKTVNSHERLLDETILFLHKVESKLPKEKQAIIRQLHRTDELLQNKKVLLVDDDMRNIYSLSNVLQEEGVNCVIAENGKVALNELLKHPDIDIVLMDIMMPEMDGYEATRQIRKMQGGSKIPIIALTAKAMPGDREKCLAAGMSDYITKPVNILQLLSLMRVWLYK